MNLALNRNLKFHEHNRFTIRAEAYNLFNRYLMFNAIPNLDPTNSLFGMIVKKDVANRADHFSAAAVGVAQVFVLIR